MRKPDRTINVTGFPACLLALYVLPMSAWAETITVPNNVQTTVQQGIDAIVDVTGTVIIKRGTYSENLVLKSGVTLQGEETAQVRIDSPDSGPAIDIETTAMLLFVT